MTLTRLTSATSGGNVTYAWTASSSPAGIGAVAVSEKQAFTLASDAGPGSFTVDGGSNTTIVAGRMVTASPRAFVETGSDATLSKTSAPINLTADPGAFDFTGTQASPVAGRAITASPGAYTATGADASPVAGRMVSAAPDAYSVTGSDAGTLAVRMIEAATEAILLSGSDATFELTIPAITISADPGLKRLGRTGRIICSSCHGI